MQQKGEAQGDGRKKKVPAQKHLANNKQQGVQLPLLHVNSKQCSRKNGPQNPGVWKTKPLGGKGAY